MPGDAARCCGAVPSFAVGRAEGCRGSGWRRSGGRRRSGDWCDLSTPPRRCGGMRGALPSFASLRGWEGRRMRCNGAKSLDKRAAQTPSGPTPKSHHRTRFREVNPEADRSPRAGLASPNGNAFLPEPRPLLRPARRSPPPPPRVRKAWPACCGSWRLQLIPTGPRSSRSRRLRSGRWSHPHRPCRPPREPAVRVPVANRRISRGLCLPSSGEPRFLPGARQWKSATCTPGIGAGATGREAWRSCPCAASDDRDSRTSMQRGQSLQGPHSLFMRRGLAQPPVHPP